MTPHVIGGAAASEVYANRIVGTMDAAGGTSLVVGYVTRGTAVGRELYLTLPLDDQWRAADGSSIDALEDVAPASVRELREQEIKIDAVMSRFAGSDVIARRRADPQLKTKLSGVVAMESDRSGRQLRSATDEVLFYYWPITEPAPPNHFVPAPRWIILPATLTIPAGDRAVHTASAVLLTPVAIIRDIVVVPAQVLTVGAAYAADPP